MALTYSQQNAVDAKGRTLLVSAAAGSGKTYTLTQRIIKAIIEDGQDITRLLIVTFTRAAAGELKAKISKALGETIAAHPENIHLQKQLIKLGSAHISTIDSFFAEPVRANFDKLGLPASMRLADDAELSPVRDEILQETLDRFFARCEHYGNAELSPIDYHNVYTDLMGIISGARDSSNLLPTFYDIYKKLITSPIGLEQLKIHSKRLNGNANVDFFETLEGKALKDELLTTVNYAWKTFVKCSNDMQSDSFVASKYTSDFLDNAAICHTLLSAFENGGYEDVRLAFDAYKPAKITSIATKDKTDQSEYYKDLRSELNKSVKDIAKKRLCLDAASLSRLFLRYSDMCALLYDILTDFDEKYMAEKRRRGVCEFSDMPAFMLKLLLSEDGKPTEYAKNLSESFDEVYIDEYQDVNEIQDSIFALIGGDRRFMVGDIKQSIYGFREAEPSIFASYRKAFSPYERDDDTLPAKGGGNTIFMSENFRCDEHVIKFTNSVCTKVFSAFADSIGYTAEDDLKFGKGRPYEDYASPKVSLTFIQTPEDDDSDDGDNYDRESQASRENSKNLGDEATAVSNQIAELLKNGKNADGSPINAGNIAVLVRSHVYTKPLISALGKMNIKYALSSKGELFENDDMRLLVNLLSVVNNPREDMPLCHLLTAKTEIYAPEFSLEEIIKLRRAADSSLSLYDAMRLCVASPSDETESLAPRCERFITLLEKMRRVSGRLSADKLIKSLIFSEKYSALTNTDAYTYLYDSACRYVKNGWSSLYSFIGYFKDLMENGEAGAESDSKINDAVRVMSIHQSKGLEFNVCFLFGFGKQFNMQNRSPIIFNKEFGASMKLPPERGEDIFENISSRYEDNPIYKTIDKYNKLKQLEEEARIFYVALTRARERLCISATLPKPYAELIEKYKKSADATYEIKKSRSYITWILLSMAQDSGLCDICSLNIFDKNAVIPTSPLPRGLIMQSNKACEGGELAAYFSRTEDGNRNEALLSTIPSKAAASKVSSHMLDDTVFSPIPTGKLFSENDDPVGDIESDTEQLIKNRIELMRSSRVDFDSLLAINKKPTAAEIGTATHAFLQFCNYENCVKNGIENEISRLRELKFISERTADIISRKQLEGFFKSSLFEYISSAVHIRREFRFGMFRSAADFTENSKLRELIADKKIFVQGSIDLFLEMPNGSLILCDYKTDRVTREERSDLSLLTKNMTERHRDQLLQYKYAVNKIFGREPDKIFIYSFALGDSIQII